MCKVYKYSELYSTDFMSYFDNKKEVISQVAKADVFEYLIYQIKILK